jgi:hypothetical protein
MKFTVHTLAEMSVIQPSFKPFHGSERPFVIFNNKTKSVAHTFATRAEAEKVAHIFETSTTAK